MLFLQLLLNQTIAISKSNHAMSEGLFIICVLQELTYNNQFFFAGCKCLQTLHYSIPCSIIYQLDHIQGTFSNAEMVILQHPKTFAITQDLIQLAKKPTRIPDNVIIE